MSLPRRTDLKVGFACNNRCVFCAQGDKRSECASIPWEELVARLRRTKTGARGLVLTGGEPTLYKNLAPLVAAARRLGYRPIQLQTNGRMLSYPAVLQRLRDAGVDEVSPSLHGSTAARHDALTRASGSFEQTVAGIRNIVASGVRVITNSVIVRDNLDHLPALVALLADLGVRAAQLALVHPVGTAFELFDEVVPRLPAVVAPLRRARLVAASRGVRLVTEAIPYCFLRGMEELAVEYRIPETTVVDLDGKVLEYSEWRVAAGKAHGPPCAGCGARHVCEGPWREYPERHGWSEFEPLGDPLREV